MPFAGVAVTEPIPPMFAPYMVESASMVDTFLDEPLDSSKDRRSNSKRGRRVKTVMALGMKNDKNAEMAMR